MHTHTCAGDVGRPLVFVYIVCTCLHACECCVCGSVLTAEVLEGCLCKHSQPNNTYSTFLAPGVGVAGQIHFSFGRKQFGMGLATLRVI
jgi:hypothetical protein